VFNIFIFILAADGRVAYSGFRNPSTPVVDNQWHMLTITSQPNGIKGYVLYLDGQQVAGINATVPVFNSNGTQLHVDGGDPMQLTGSIILCSRSDDPSERHFDGDLAYLSLWDQALSPAQVQSLYSAVEVKAAAVVRTPAPIGPVKEAPALSTRQPQASSTRFSQSGRPCQFPAVYDGQVVTDCVDISGVPFCQVGKDEPWEACFVSQPPVGEGGDHEGSHPTRRPNHHDFIHWRGD